MLIDAMDFQSNFQQVNRGGDLDQLLSNDISKAGSIEQIQRAVQTQFKSLDKLNLHRSKMGQTNRVVHNAQKYEVCSCHENR